MLPPDYRGVFLEIGYFAVSRNAKQTAGMVAKITMVRPVMTPALSAGTEVITPRLTPQVRAAVAEPRMIAIPVMTVLAACFGFIV
jgi:hypothetical protein